MSHDACTSGSSRVLTIASLLWLQIETLIPAPADYEALSVINRLEMSVQETQILVKNDMYLPRLYQCAVSLTSRNTVFPPPSIVMRSEPNRSLYKDFKPSDKVFECTEHSAYRNSSSAVPGLWRHMARRSTHLLQEFGWEVFNLALSSTLEHGPRTQWFSSIITSVLALIV